MSELRVSLDQVIAGGERENPTIRLLQMAAIVEKRRRQVSSG